MFFLQSFLVFFRTHDIIKEVMEVGSLHKCKNFFWGLIFLLLGLALLAFLSFDKYLLTLQKDYRLAKIERYDNFTMSLQKENRCTLKKIGEVKETEIFYYCLERVYIHYGSTTEILEVALQNDLISISDILSHTTRVEKDFYHYKNTKQETEFYLYFTNNQLILMPDAANKALF